MQVGSVVRYRKKYPDGMDIDWIGIVAEIGYPHPMDRLEERIFFRVDWSNGLWDWRTEWELEVICE